MAKIKGTALIPAVKFVRKNRAELAPHLDDIALRLCEERILPGSWYPLDDATHLLVGIARYYNGNLETAMQTLGTYLAETDLKGMYAPVLQPGDVVRTGRRAATIWQSYMDTGVVRYIQADPARNECVVRLESFPQSLPYCQCIAGMARVVVRMSGGGDDPEIKELKCSLKGDDECEFVIRW
jgi:hypothetical protein